MIKYSEQWDANYNGITGEWLESKCDDPTCEYCASRPDKAMVNVDEKLRFKKIEDIWREAGGSHDAGNQHVWPSYKITDLQKFADLLIESIVEDLEDWKSGYDDRAAFNIHEMVGLIQERIRGI